MKSPSLDDASSNLSRYFELQRHLNNHIKRIENVQPTIRIPKQNLNQSNHIKKQPLAQFNRIMTIDIQNKALLKKLTNKSPSNISKSRPYQLIKNNSRKNMQEYKKRLQNEGLLKRIKQAKSSYLNMKFASERRATERYINAISKFGYKKFTPNKTIMQPFLKNAIPQPKKLQDSIQNERKQSTLNKEYGENKAQFDTIIKIDKKVWQKEEVTGEIVYIQWAKKFTIQINVGTQEGVNLVISKEIFEQKFGRCLMKVHENIKYNHNSKTFYLDLNNNNNFY